MNEFCLWVCSILKSQKILIDIGICKWNVGFNNFFIKWSICYNNFLIKWSVSILSLLNLFSYHLDFFCLFHYTMDFQIFVSVLGIRKSYYQ